MLKKLLFSLVSALVLSLVTSTPVRAAGNDLTVSCPSIGSCGVSPSGVPIFQEFGWIPGSSAIQRLRMTNTAGQNGFAAMEVIDYEEIKDLGEIIRFEIRRGSPVGSLVYGGVTLHQFRDDGYFTFDTINSGQTIDYYLIAYMPASAGNKYQGANVIFDLKMGLELTPIVPPSGGGDGAGNPGGGSGPAPTCTADAPASAPSVTITNVGVNTVSLAWTSVAPVTHYALVFTRNSDGAQYGSTNIGNVTNYTITNLSGGAGYTFEVFGINDCAPGPRGTASSGIVGGAVIEGRPLGPGGQVLGVTTEEETVEPVAELTSQEALSGQVAGLFDETCALWRQYVPWILLVAQFLLILLAEWIYRSDGGLTKHFIAVGLTLASIALFYLLRECDCYSGGFLAWLCKWYWLVSLLLTGVIKLVSYAFIEEVAAETKTQSKSQ